MIRIEGGREPNFSKEDLLFQLGNKGGWGGTKFFKGGPIFQLGKKRGGPGGGGGGGGPNFSKVDRFFQIGPLGPFFSEMYGPGGLF